MEKRFFLGIGILVVFLVLGLLITVWMERINLSVAQELEQAVQSAQAGDFLQGTMQAQRAKENWQSGWKWIAAAADHNPMDEIDALFAQVDFYTRTGQTEAFGACCARICELVNAVTDDHRLTWWNFL